MLNKNLLTLIAVIAGIFMPQSLTAQCTDGTTTTLQPVFRVRRTGGNTVESYGGSQVYGGYWYEWDTYIDATATNPSGTHSGSGWSGYGGNDEVGTAGTYVHRSWNDSPSSTGAGTYSLATFHEFVSTCGDDYTYSNNVSLTVKAPSVSPAPSMKFWNLGSGTADPTTSQSKDGLHTYGTYYQNATLSMSTNCNAGDTCSDTPQWCIAGTNSQATLGGSLGCAATGTTAVVNKTSTQGDCLFDTYVTVSIGGFTSAAYYILVDSPDRLLHYADTTNTGSPSGYSTLWYYRVKDTCSPANVILSVPLYETFGAISEPGVISGWGAPTATNGIGFNVDDLTFADEIASTNSSFNPAPTWTATNAPFTYNTVIQSIAQTWTVGASSSGGTSMQSGTLTYYLDHGTGYGD